jgi:dihydrodipicolinate synthase/N-acetylneuraminate lyase
MLAYFKLEGRAADLELVREAERLGADVEMIITLLYNGKSEEAVKLLRR